MLSKPGFVQIAPQTDFTATCPTCRAQAGAVGWHVPGLWTLAELKCGGCGASFLEDLPYSLGVVTPFVLEPATGAATPRYSGQWYADQAAEAWKNRVTQEVAIRVVRNPRSRQACLVNCLYPWWGDAVSLLFRVNQIRSNSDLDIIVLINPALEWLVPDYVGGVWVVEQGFSKNAVWNESLGSALNALVASLALDLFLPVTFQPAHLTQAEIREASKIEPFPRREWNHRLEEKPVVTFMWRTDRTWSKYGLRQPPSRLGKFLERLEKKFPRLRSLLRTGPANREQLRNVCRLAEELRTMFPKLEFAVCGIGKRGEFPPWIKDMRVDAFAADTNRLWSLQAAQSHTLCGVLGSHLSLPGSFAGSYIELVPNNFLRNILTCTSVTSREPRHAIYINRLLPINVDPLYLADVIAAIMINYSYIEVAFKDEYYKPLTLESLGAVRKALSDRRSSISKIDPAVRDRLGN